MAVGERGVDVVLNRDVKPLLFSISDFVFLIESCSLLLDQVAFEVVLAGLKLSNRNVFMPLVWLMGVLL